MTYRETKNMDLYYITLPLKEALRRFGPRMRELTNLSDGRSSSFMHWMNTAETFEGKNTAILAFEGNKVVGQSLTYWGAGDPTLIAGFYVEPDKRRQGVGKFLYYAAHRQFGDKMRCTPHDIPSTALFKSVKARTGDYWGEYVD